MVYKTVSCKNVIARLIRNIRLNDSSYTDDLIEWIGEAIDELRTKYTLIPTSTTLTITSHSSKLPCGLVSISAVAYEGVRLREGSSVVDVTNAPAPLNRLNGTATSFFETDEEAIIQNHISGDISGSEITINETNIYNQFYKLHLDYLQTSFEEGEVVIHYTKRPVDERGYPLIPDQEDYKRALYYYLLTMLQQAGYEYKIIPEAEALKRYELYASRAISKIKYPTVDRMERIKQSTTRLIPAQHFYEDFFVNAEQVQEIRKQM